MSLTCEQCGGTGFIELEPGNEATEVRCTLCFGTGGEPDPMGWRRDDGGEHKT